MELGMGIGSSNWNFYFTYLYLFGKQSMNTPTGLQGRNGGLGAGSDGSTPNPPTETTVEKWRLEFAKIRNRNYTKEWGSMLASIEEIQFIEKLLTQSVQEAKAEEAEKFGAFLHKLAWSDKEIQDAWDWVERTPLRLKKDFKLQSTLNTKGGKA